MIGCYCFLDDSTHAIRFLTMLSGRILGFGVQTVHARIYFTFIGVEDNNPLAGFIPYLLKLINILRVNTCIDS